MVRIVVGMNVWSSTYTLLVEMHVCVCVRVSLVVHLIRQPKEVDHHCFSSQ